MKKYKSIFGNKDIDLQLAEAHEQGEWICGEYLFEAVINPDLYIQNLLQIMDDNKEILKKYKDVHPQDLCNELSKLYESHKIIFTVLSKNKDVFIYFGSTNKENIITIWCNTTIVNAYKNYKKFKIEFEKFLKHEIIHREQNIRINNEEEIKKAIKKGKNGAINYYSSKQEIMAYAWQIVYDFRIAGKTDNVIKQLIGKDSFFATKYSKSLQTYKELFKKDSSVLKLLYKYIYMYLN